MKEEDRKSINRSIGLDRYIAKKDACKDYEQHTTSFIFADGYSEGFEDGAKRGYEKGYEDCRHYAHDYYKPKWHDLRENPDDLPKAKERRMYRVIYSNPDINEPCLWYLPNLKSWSHSLPVIAWCELPQFKR